MGRERENEGKGETQYAGIEAEIAVLGAVLADNTLMGDVVQIVHPDDFGGHRHAAIFLAMLQIDSRAAKIDHLTLADELKKMGKLAEVGGPAYLMALDQGVPFTHNATQYAQIVKDQAARRRLVAAGEEIAATARSGQGEVDDIQGFAEQRILTLGERRISGEMRPLSDYTEGVLTQLDAMKQKGNGITGLPSGFIDLDEQLTGFHPGELIIIAARPGIGKTSLAMNMAQHVALKDEKTVGVYSLEMPGEQLLMRMIATHAAVDLKKMRGGRLTMLEEERFTESTGVLHNAPIFIDDSGDLTPVDLRAKARRLKQKRPDLSLLVIDYLQLMHSRGKAESRQMEVSEISRSLKQLAKELEIPVIALSQMSRKVEERKKGKPMLSDLRESGSIEQDADVVLFIHREEGEQGKDEEPQPQKDILEVELIVAKQRNGPIGSVPILFEPALTRFQNRAKGSQWN